ncbi:MAG: hypothetical protein AB7F86_08270 [Bdellovibrionales bacterium]
MKTQYFALALVLTMPSIFAHAASSWMDQIPLTKVKIADMEKASRENDQALAFAAGSPCSQTQATTAPKFKAWKLKFRDGSESKLIVYKVEGPFVSSSGLARTLTTLESTPEGLKPRKRIVECSFGAGRENPKDKVSHKMACRVETRFDVKPGEDRFQTVDLDGISVEDSKIPGLKANECQIKDKLQVAQKTLGIKAASRPVPAASASVDPTPSAEDGAR